MAKEENRCWPGYEPVPGKRAHEQGSCRKTARSKLTPSGKRVRAARRRQLDEWQKEHPHTRRSASQGLPPPTTESTTKAKTKPKKKRSSTAPKRTAAKRTGAKRTAAERKARAGSAARRTPKKTTPRRKNKQTKRTARSST